MSSYRCHYFSCVLIHYPSILKKFLYLRILGDMKNIIPGSYEFHNRIKSRHKVIIKLLIR